MESSMTLSQPIKILVGVAACCFLLPFSFFYYGLMVFPIVLGEPVVIFLSSLRWSLFIRISLGVFTQSFDLRLVCILACDKE
jgi:hypothetical protein